MWDDLQERATTCSYCPNLCLHACPVSNAERRSTVAPWAKMSEVRWAGERRQPLSAETASIFYKCTGCGACTDACLHEIDVPGVLEQARHAAVQAGVQPYSAEALMPDPVALENATSDEARAETRAADALAIDVHYLPNCRLQLADPAEVQATAHVLRRASSGPVDVLGSECCGAPLWTGGYGGEFRDHIRQRAAHLSPNAALVVDAGACRRAFGELAAEVGVASVRPSTLAQFVAPRLERLTLQKIPGKWAIVGGCSEMRAEAGPPPWRTVITACLAEPPAVLRWHGRLAHCCGAQGGYAQTSPDGAADAGRRVLEQCVDAGASGVVVVDSECLAHLRGASGSPSDTLPDGIVGLGGLLHRALISVGGRASLPPSRNGGRSRR